MIYIYIGSEDFENLNNEGKGKLIVHGHMASDSVCINPFIRELKRMGVSALTLGVIPA